MTEKLILQPIMFSKIIFTIYTTSFGHCFDYLDGELSENNNKYIIEILKQFENKNKEKSYLISINRNEDSALFNYLKLKNFIVIGMVVYKSPSCRYILIKNNDLINLMLFLIDNNYNKVYPKELYIDTKNLKRS